jgi:ADP-ribosylglycohydrolase
MDPAVTTRARFRGCLVGGAVGDALGAAVEFESLASIRRRYGPEGIAEFDEAYGRRGAITDDTQMTLFTADGLLRSLAGMKERGTHGAPAASVKDAYLRWLRTQGVSPPEGFASRPASADGGWLLTHPELLSRRGPGNTCLMALERTPYESLVARNDSKGCGGPMRVAPVALFAAVAGPRSESELYPAAFQLGADLAAITHGHPTAQLASGAFAVMILAALRGATLRDGSDRALDLLGRGGDAGECLEAIARARELAFRQAPPAEAIPMLGEGWIAEEAVAIALYCALMARDFAHGVRLAVNHQGDSDSTGAMTGNLLGALQGEDAIPRRWRDAVELGEAIADVAEDFLRLAGSAWEADDRRRWRHRYPPS